MGQVPKLFHVVDTTVKIVICNQFGGEDAKEMIRQMLEHPAVLSIEFEDTMTWEKGMHPLQKDTEDAQGSTV